MFKTFPTCDWQYYQTAWFLVSTPLLFILSVATAALSEARS